MIRRLFTDIAGIYDRMNRLLSLGRDSCWREAAVARVTIAPRRILDLACGTGDLAFALARRFPQAKIVGADLTPAMLELARRKNRSPQVSFVEAVAERLDSVPLGLAPGSVDLVACAFGFRNFADRDAAFDQVRRIMADEAELLVLEFFRPSRGLLTALTALWLKLAARCLAPKQAWAYACLCQSMRTTISKEEFVRLAEDRGLTLIDERFFWPCCTCLLFGLSRERPAH